MEQQRNAGSFELLPFEVLMELVNVLPFRDLLRLCTTNTLFRQLLQQEEIRQLIGNRLRPRLVQMQKEKRFHCFVEIRHPSTRFWNGTLMRHGPLTRLETALQQMFPSISNFILLHPEFHAVLFVGFLTFCRVRGYSSTVSRELRYLEVDSVECISYMSDDEPPQGVRFSYLSRGSCLASCSVGSPSITGATLFDLMWAYCARLRFNLEQNAFQDVEDYDAFNPDDVDAMQLVYEKALWFFNA